MTSTNKMKKAKNSYCANALKQGIGKLKRVFSMMPLNANIIKKYLTINSIWMHFSIL